MFSVSDVSYVTIVVDPNSTRDANCVAGGKVKSTTCPASLQEWRGASGNDV